MIPFNVFQVAYVTDDIDAAVAIAGPRFGIERFQINREVPIATGSGTALASFALAFIGETQIELIQPAGGPDAVYRDGIKTSGGGLTLHHLGCLITDQQRWLDTVAAAHASGLPIPVEGAFGDLMHYLYVDHRDTLGHHLEYMWQTPAGRDLFTDNPRFPG